VIDLITGHGTVSLAIAAIKAGFRLYRDAAARGELLDCVARSLHRNDAANEERLANRALNWRRARVATSREREVLGAVPPAEAEQDMLVHLGISFSRFRRPCAHSSKSLQCPAACPDLIRMAIIIKKHPNP